MWDFPQTLTVWAGFTGLNQTRTVETFGILVTNHKSLAARCIQRNSGSGAFCVLPSLARRQLCFCLHPAAFEWWSPRTDRAVGGVSLGYSGLSSCLSYSVLLYISKIHLKSCVSLVLGFETGSQCVHKAPWSRLHVCQYRKVKNGRGFWVNLFLLPGGGCHWTAAVFRPATQPCNDR